MRIQSLSVVVPNKKCINNCMSCPSRMHGNEYPDLLDERKHDFYIHIRDYLKRLRFAKDNGCNTIVLTGTSEPQQNRKFLTWFGMMMEIMDNPFGSIEMQCTGALLDDDYIQLLRTFVGVNLIALSMFSLDMGINNDTIRPPKGIYIDLPDVASRIKAAGMQLRMCLNLTRSFNDFKNCPEILFDYVKKNYGADQVTLRVLYADDESGPEANWVRRHAAKPETVAALKEYVKAHGVLLGRLPYGAKKYGIDGMSVVIDDDCMGKQPSDIDSYKYLILQPDCRLYSAWDNKGSLVF